MRPRRDIAETTVCLLFEERKSARAREDQIGKEVVVQIRSKNCVAIERSALRARKSQLLSTGNLDARLIGP